MNTNVKKITTLGMMSALAYVAMVLIHLHVVPAMPFLTYDPKDVVIVIGGLIYGPMSAFIMALVVAFVEMVTVSGTGIIGMIMNVISTVAFAVTASLIYKRKHTMSGAIAGLLAGVVTMTAVMVLWNYIITPYYMHIPRQEVVKLLIPALIPFNVIKASLNAGLTMLLYKPVVLTLRKTSLLEQSEKPKRKFNPGMIILGLFLVATSVLVILILQGVI
ncbi:MAG: ECF transporter S component [Clostridiaceae bacterium]|nr:ECF transporter S component [Clostridiaceae bacterium]